MSFNRTPLYKTKINQLQQIQDKYQTYEELTRAIQKAGIESMQLVLGFDFSKSNEWTGELSFGKHLHGLDYVNPYQQILRILQPIYDTFDDDGIVPAYRFGCLQTKDRRVLSLRAPESDDPHFANLKEVEKAYVWAVQTQKLSGPTTFAPMIYQAIEIAREHFKSGSTLVVLVILTDGDVSNFELDKQAICQASAFPISIVAVGVGDGPFDKMVRFDDMGGREFDNFQFVNFTKLQKQLGNHPNPELVLATAIFNEIPDQYAEMKRLKYL